jgi:dihydrofolate reductase
MIRLIAALDSRRGIATDSGIPWSLPGDSAYFRQKTLKGTIVMGRATYDEFAAPLHDRENFVLTRSDTALRDGFQPITRLDDVRQGRPDDDVWVLGGAAVYEETIASADELLLTQVDGDFHCTKFFPSYEADFALETRSEAHEEGGVTYRFEKWRARSRRSPEAGG